MSVYFALLFALLCFAVPASAQTEVPAEIIDAVRKSEGSYVAEALRELLLVIGYPGAWLLKNEWILAMLLGLLVWAVVGRIVLPPLKIWVTEGTGKKFIDAAHGTFDRFGKWCEEEIQGPAGKRALAPAAGILVFLVAFFLGVVVLAVLEEVKASGWMVVFLMYGFAFAVAMIGLGCLAWALWKIGGDAYKTAISISQPSASVDYPYSLRLIFIGLLLGAVGLAGVAIGVEVVGLGEALVKNMGVLAGDPIRLVGSLIVIPCVFLLPFAALLLIDPILHGLAVLVMWPVVIVFKKGVAEVAPSSEHERR